jgi:hypothetical protein
MSMPLHHAFGALVRQPPPAAAATVGGNVEAPTVCGAGANLKIGVVVDRPDVQGNWYELTAWTTFVNMLTPCCRSP